MRVLILLLTAATSLDAHADFEGIGRDATVAEVKAWDIDVRPDFKGLPPGSGSVADGEALWIAKCTSCHGDFGDANHVFVPLVGNTTAEDIKAGRVAALKAGGSVRTTFTKLSTVSTLWDYIHRAMPWDAPKSLSPNQVYAVLAYLLNLAEIVPADYVLSDKSIAEVQKRIPNRNGMTREHGLWDVNGRPDTSAKACSRNCKTEVKILSELPDHARSAHGDLSKQNREYGAVRGQKTAAAKAEVAAKSATANPSPASSAAGNTAVTSLIGSKGCGACHGLDKKIVGPGFNEIAAKYKARADAKIYLAGKIMQGGSGAWGAIPMPPQAQLSKAEVDSIAAWITAGAKP